MVDYLEDLEYIYIYNSFEGCHSALWPYLERCDVYTGTNANTQLTNSSFGG